MSETNGKEFAEFRGEMRARFDGLERNIEDFKREVRDDFARGQEKFDKIDERLRGVPTNDDVADIDRRLREVPTRDELGGINDRLTEVKANQQAIAAHDKRISALEDENIHSERLYKVMRVVVPIVAALFGAGAVKVLGL